MPSISGFVSLSQRRRPKNILFHKKSENIWMKVVKVWSSFSSSAFEIPNSDLGKMIGKSVQFIDEKINYRQCSS